MMTSVLRIRAKTVPAVTLALEMLQSALVLLGGLAIVAKLEALVANPSRTNKKLQFHKCAKMVEGVLTKEPLTDVIAKMNTMAPTAK